MINKYTKTKILMFLFLVLLVARPVLAQDGSEGDVEWMSIFESIAMFIADIFENSAEMMRNGIDILTGSESG